MCPHCRAFIDPKEKVCTYCDNPLPKAYGDRVDTGTALRGLIPSTHFTTFIILAINFGVFMAMLLLTRKVGADALWNVDSRVSVLFGAMFRYSIVVDGEWWRLITAGFLHGGVLHILMNSWVMYDLAASVEQIFETPRFLVIYLVSNVTGFWFSMATGNVLSVGASAALCGLIGAMLAYARRSGQSFLWKAYMRWIIMIAIFGMIFPAIDNAAHFGGLAGGFAVGWLAASNETNRAIESMWKAAAFAACAITAVAFVYAYVGISRAF